MSNSLKAISLSILTALSLSACGVSNAITSDGQLRGEPRFESPYKDTYTQSKGDVRGIIVDSLEDPILRTVKVGDHKSDVMYNKLGRPHFHEGFGSKLLTYTFSDRDGNKCMLKLGFDKNNRVGSVHYFPEGCAKIPEPKVETPQVVERIIRETPKMKKITLNAGALFDFDKAVIKEEYASELKQLARAVGQLNNVNRIIVVGHTDQSGTDAYNQVLSEKRARSVANYLVAYGAPAEAMHVVGMGESEPIKDCGNPDRPNAETKACNYENRRVDIFIDGSVEQMERQMEEFTE